ncbi:MAG: flagellar hook-basal body complex protein [Firmicutes bacterium]|nr:flagellar hook-basal body complex protein [Bacillota bacterium]
MIRSIYTASSGMRNHQVRMDVIANNISNVNTTGFKSGRVNFAEMLSQSYLSNAYTQVSGNTQNSSQIGLGVSVSAINNNFSQGDLQTTGRVLDVAIAGEGFFMVTPSSDSIQDDNIYYTRDGDFYINKDGYLVNSSGQFVLDDQKQVITISDPATAISSLSIDTDGNVKVNGQQTAKIGVAVFNNPEVLAKMGGNLYKNPDPANITPVLNPAGEIYKIDSGTLEMSNTDLTTEFSNMIMTQRGYQANARVITTSDQMLGELVDLKR